jgi:hypothetical protein
LDDDDVVVVVVVVVIDDVDAVDAFLWCWWGRED